ncbi:IS3 family transposase, partial [Lentilactobacillus farraginis]|uniref:IS3 family transposase n=1 Tax=Lentilactobacillus farraginis TaxID=390841 RepID=UPI003B82DE2E
MIMYIWNSDHHMGIIRITQVIRTEFDLKVNHKRVDRLMKQLNIYGEGYHKKTRKY